MQTKEHFKWNRAWETIWQMMCVCVSSFRFTVHLFSNSSSTDHGRFKKRQRMYDAKGKVIKNHRFPEYIWDVVFHSFICLKELRLCECIWLWKSMIMELMNTYRRFRFILCHSANDKTPNHRRWDKAIEKRMKKKQKISPCLRRTWPPIHAKSNNTKQKHNEQKAKVKTVKLNK